MNTLCDILERMRQRPTEEVVRFRPPGAAADESWSGERFVDRVDECARGLSAIGVRAGDRVGLLCANRPEWHFVDFACQRVGAVLVPLFSTLSAAQVAFAFADSGCRVIVVDSAEQLDKVRATLTELPDVVAVVTVDPLPGATLSGTHRLLSLAEACAAADSTIRLSGPAGPDALATLIYTSGTTGPPKGVMLTHANLLANASAVVSRVPCGPADVGLSVLPLCHAYERTVDYAYLLAGVRVVYSSPQEMADDFQRVRPTMVIGVPRLYEKIRENVEDRVRRTGGLGWRLYRLAVEVGERRARARVGQAPIRLVDSLLQPLLDALVGRRIRAGLGGRLRVLSAGGAALDDHVTWWFMAFGLEILQGYGLTESSPIIACNTLGANRIGTVGRPLDNVEVRIAEDGEILTRGPHVMAGYWQRPEATAETVVDGWLHTGDVGILDEDGYLRITDRKKSLIVTSTGKKVAPTPIEGALTASPFIDQVLVLGDDRRFIAALIVPSFDRLGEWAARRRLPTDPEAMCASEQVRELLRGEIDRLQPDRARYERVREFRLLPERFSASRGQLTPTLKLVRSKILQDYAPLVEEIYEH